MLAGLIAAANRRNDALNGVLSADAHIGAAPHLKPGELDTYYGLWSGGHTGDVRVLGMPSGRELLRIPCFVPDALVGWGITNESKAVMGTKADGSLRYTVADTHHVHASYKDGNYDGRYAWVNDKINARLARIRLDYFICDKITDLPNVQGFHGIFPDKRDPVKAEINYTTRVFAGGEFGIPLDGKATDDGSKYRSLFTCVDAETMDVRWQVLIDGNCDLTATSYDGKLAATNQYNTENGIHYEDMMSAERDACLFFNVARIEAAVKAGTDKQKLLADGKSDKDAGVTFAKLAGDAARYACGAAVRNDAMVARGERRILREVEPDTTAASDFSAKPALAAWDKLFARAYRP